jgi:hypothetical protein
VEAEQLLTNHHHVAVSAGQGVEQVAPLIEPPQPAFDLAALWAKREQLIQGLNQARTQLETQAQSVARTEGALLMLNTLIAELDPAAFKQEQGQGG